MKSISRPSVIIGLLSLVFTSGVSAQTTSTTDVAVGYSFLRITEGEGYNLPAGWLVSVSHRVAPLVWVVGEGAGNYRQDGEWLLLHSVMGGVRVAPSSSVGVRPFAQVLAGAALAYCCGEMDGKFAIEPGGGADLPVGRRSALRIGVSFPIVFVDGETMTLFRFQTAVVFRLGG